MWRPIPQSYLTDHRQSTKNGIERELARIRGLLEKRYSNPSDSGYTFVTDEGKKIPLTPSMLSEWSRAVVCTFQCFTFQFALSSLTHGQYDGNVNIHQPPNTITFDPKTRRRSLFHQDQLPASTSTDSTAPGFSAVASILHDIVTLVGPKNGIYPPSTPVRSTSSIKPAAKHGSLSPAQNTPSKLPAYLQYAQDHLGVRQCCYGYSRFFFKKWAYCSK